MLPDIAALLKANPLVAGGAGMAVVGWLMVQARSLPMRLVGFAQDQLSVSMTVFSEDKFFELLDLWLSRHPGTGRVRRFTVARWWNRSSDRDEFALAPGSGLHIVREGWRLYFVNRHVENKSSGELSEAKRRQTITVMTPGRSRAPICGLLDRIKEVHEDEDTIPVYVWNSMYTDFSLVERRRKRPMDTVYLEASTKTQIVEDVRRFLENRAWYVERGIPYRRGYMFEGPPGTGKTTLILALASLFNKAVYIINPAAIENDSAFQRAVSQAGSNFVVIEDVDSVEQAESRETKKKKVVHSAVDATKAGITLSGLLNAIDGIAARDGRLLFITTNRPDVLDAALLRPGRIDMRTHLGYSGAAEAREMFVKFFPEGDADAFCAGIAPELPISPALLQNRLLSLGAAAIKAA